MSYKQLLMRLESCWPPWQRWAALRVLSIHILAVKIVTDQCHNRPAPHRSSESGVSCWADAATSVSSAAVAGCDDASPPVHARQPQRNPLPLHGL